MKKVLIGILVLFLLYVNAGANNDGVYGDGVSLFRKRVTESTLLADSIMRIVIENAVKYQNVLSSYEAEIYIKGRTEVLKSNYLIRFGNKLFPMDRKNKDMIFEMVSHSRYDAPRNYYHDFEAIYGNSIPNQKKQEEFIQFLNLNVYAPTAYNDGFIMPLAKNAFKYYNFSLQDIQWSDGLKIYRIRFLPKQWSQKLISGDLYIVDQSWTVDKIDLSGRVPFGDFNFIMTFSRDFRRFTLPLTADLFLRYKLLGNAIASSYHADFNFNAVEWVEENHERRKKSLDLSRYYRLSSHTIAIISDSAYWAKKRITPLTEEEENLYRIKTMAEVAKTDTTDNGERYLEITEKLTSTLNFNSKTSRIRYSGLLNPFQLGYSKRNGITYRQRIRYNKTFANGQLFQFRPQVGYVFKNKEIFFSIPFIWEYYPEKMGFLELTFGNDNTGYPSKVMDDINQMLKDSLDFDHLNLKYFEHYYVELKNNFEVQNGLQIWAGLSYHRRVPVKDKSAPEVDEETDDGITDQIFDKYNDFTPSVGISYTPRQYYRKDGRKKEYVYSDFPTFTLEFARGVKGVGGSTGDYARIEADIHQSIDIGLLRKFNYRVSGGLFTLAKSTYFADFRYFRRRYFPETWDDHIGGVFNLLKGEWYNASNKYIQAHFMYESPFMLTQIFKRKSAKHIFSERFYYSHLSTPVLKSYSEIGYGFGNHIFNVAVFGSFKKHEFQSTGFKFVFELF